MFYAHIREDGKMQTVEEHLKGTAERSQKFAAAFSQEDRGYLIGYVHDAGKCSQAFQRRLLEDGPKVDHATAGALECAKINEMFSACCVIGHHGGLPDYGNSRADLPGTPTFIGRLKNGMQQKIPPYQWDEKIQALPQPQFPDGFTQSLWVRMLYSCLVDADYLDTEEFMAPKERSTGDTLPVLLERLKTYIAPWFPAKNELNRHRCQILKQCQAAGNLPKGIYSLTVPTGGGKTIASLAFGLAHAVKHQMQRVIYVVPYTSIIEQNAQVFRNILGEQNVVEHHSGVDMDAEEGASHMLRQQLATENWDGPVIITTAVQFFESLYSNRPSQCRKLHNIANSVVIFDEAQMLPACHLRPCVGAIANLTAHFGATAVLCTATQPVLGDLVQEFCPELSMQEICPNAKELFDQFRRVTYRNGGRRTNEALCNQMAQMQQVLCIVNTRKTAQDIFDGLPEEGRFHLSTLMYPDHRKRVLEKIRCRLKNGQICRVVSTSLIEAGVDIDFPAVYRELAGLDSIIQAAGRCNREGKRPVEESVVTYFEGERPAPLLQQVNIGAAREALMGGADPGDPETICRYFVAWRSLMGTELDKSKAVEYLRKGYRGCSLPFRTVAENFHFIDNATKTVYIPLEEGAALCKRIQSGYADRADYRKAGQYSVSIYEHHYRALLEAGDILPVNEGSAVLVNLQLYDAQMGLSMKADPGRDEFI